MNGDNLTYVDSNKLKYTPRETNSNSKKESKQVFIEYKQMVQ